MAQPVSNRWRNLIRSGYRPLTEVDLRFPGEGTVLTNLPVTPDGHIQFDRTQQVRSKGRVTLADPELFLELNEDTPVTPHGAELAIRSGLIYPEGRANQPSQIELIPMGVFPIVRVEASEADGNIPTVQFEDRFRHFKRTSYITPIDYSGELVQSVIEEVALESAPLGIDNVEWTVFFHPDLDNFELPTGTVLEGDRGDFLFELAESLGADIYFDRSGDLRIDPVPGIFAHDDTVEADWEVFPREQGNLIDANRQTSNQDVYNGVVVVGNGDSDRPAPFAFETDDDPLSPTYYEGRFGKSVTRIEDDKLHTEEQCAKRARAKLRDSTGLQREVDLEILPNAAMDVGDVLRAEFYRDGTQTGAEPKREFRLVDGFRFNFNAAAFSPTTRAVQHISEES